MQFDFVGFLGVVCAGVATDADGHPAVVLHVVSAVVEDARAVDELDAPWHLGGVHDALSPASFRC